ncbi:MAG: hypothetical protein HC817_12585, partial [Saprospiraceae bacterium]|nr:hypothetical protein [Saprospiraceae bacterium]
QYQILRNTSFQDSVTGATLAETTNFEALGCGTSGSGNLYNRILDLTNVKTPFTRLLVAMDWNKCSASPARSFALNTAVTPAEGGSATGAGVYFTGDTVALKASVNATFSFVNWTDNGREVSKDSLYRFPMADSVRT